MANLAVFLGVVLLAVLLIQWRLGGSVCAAVVFVSIWWLFWMGVSAFGVAGLEVPEAQTYLIFLLFIASMAVGNALPERKKVHQNKSSDTSNKSDNFDLLLRAVAIIIFAIVLATFVSSRSAIQMSESMRTTALMRSSEEDAIFAYPFLRNLYNFTVQPAVLVITLSGFWGFLFRNQYFLLIIGTSASFLNAAIFFGRFGIYVTPVLFFSSLILLGKQIDKSVLRRGVVLLAMMLVGGLTSAAAITFSRREGVEDLEALFRQFINYHTAGFVLMDHELSSDASMVNSEIFYGRLTLGPVEDLFSVVMRRIDRDYFPIALNAIEYRETFQEIGNYDGTVIYGNAYFTILFTLLVDGGYIYLIAGGVLIGLVLKRLYRSVKTTPSRHNFCMFMLFIWLGLFSIFQSVLESRTLWFGALFIILFKKESVLSQKGQLQT